MTVRVALLDSGVTASHPHLAGLRLDGFSLEGLEPPLQRSDDFSDRTGHGTACTAALYRLEPRIDVLAVRLLDEELRTTTAALAEGIVRAAEAGAQVINLSLGSGRPEAEATLRDAVQAASRAGAICVAAAHPRGRSLWPADLPEVLSAATHRDCPLADLYRVAGPLPRYVASGWPRPIEGRPARDNLFGTSFAAVHLTARVAGLVADGTPVDHASLVSALDAACAGPWKDDGAG